MILLSFTLTISTNLLQEKGKSLPQSPQICLAHFGQRKFCAKHSLSVSHSQLRTMST